jgi:hypothetical protein
MFRENAKNVKTVCISTVPEQQAKARIMRRRGSEEYPCAEGIVTFVHVSLGITALLTLYSSAGSIV